MSQLLVSRQARALVILTELFNGPVRVRVGRTELSELVHHTELVKQIKVVWNRVSQAIGGPVQELAALQRTRERELGWLKLRIWSAVSRG